MEAWKFELTANGDVVRNANATDVVVRHSGDSGNEGAVLAFFDLARQCVALFREHVVVHQRVAL